MGVYLLILWRMPIAMSAHRHHSSHLIYGTAVPHYRAQKMSLLYDSVKIKILERKLRIPILLQFHKTVKNS